MPTTESNAFPRRAPIERMASFLIKTAVLLGLIFLFARLAPVMPPFFIGLFWAVLSIVSAIGITYHVVIKKTYRQSMLKEGGRLAQFNNGRVISLIIGFIASALCMFGLIIEAPTWDVAEWLIAVAAIPLFLVASLFISRFVNREYEPLFRTSRIALWSGVIVAIVLCILEILVILLEPTTHYADATEAFTATAQPFNDSPSAILSETGKYTALIDGLTAYGLSKTAEFSFAGYLVWRVLLSVSALFVIANLISTCSLNLEDMRRVFMPLEASKKPGTAYSPVKKYVVTAGMLPLALLAVFLIADAGFSHIAKTEEYTSAENFIRDQIGVAVYVLDGKYYDQKAVDNLIAEAKEKSNSLMADAEKTIVPLINEAYDKRLENVDSYLDWYYSLPADYERLAQIFTDTVEEGMREHLSEQLNQGVDDEELSKQLESYLEQAESLKSELMGQLSEYEIDNVPDWLIDAKEPLDTDFLSKPLEPTEQFIGAGGRFGLSVGVSAIGSIVGKKLTEKVLAKPFFNKLVTKLTQALAARGLGTALGGGVGTVIAPGIGTAAGIAAGTVLGIATDYLFLKADEGLNREEYKNEIIDGIEEERASMLAIVQQAGQSTDQTSSAEAN